MANAPGDRDRVGSTVDREGFLLLLARRRRGIAFDTHRPVVVSGAPWREGITDDYLTVRIAVQAMARGSRFLATLGVGDPQLAAHRQVLDA